MAVELTMIMLVPTTSSFEIFVPSLSCDLAQPVLIKSKLMKSTQTLKVFHRIWKAGQIFFFFMMRILHLLAKGWGWCVVIFFLWLVLSQFCLLSLIWIFAFYVPPFHCCTHFAQPTIRFPVCLTLLVLSVCIFLVVFLPAFVTPSPSLLSLSLPLSGKRTHTCTQIHGNTQ